MAKDINIHLKTTGAEATQQKLSGVGKAAERAGEAAKRGGKKGSEGLDEMSRSTAATQGQLGFLGRTISTLKAQVVGLVTAWLSIQGVQRIFGAIIASMERMIELQKKLLEKAIPLSRIGQALEFQTGTVGKQQYWARQALDLQRVGGLTSTNAAKEMMVAMDIAFSQQGGIRNEEIMELARQLAPFVGGAQLQGPEVAKLFEFAGIAGVQPAAEDYKQYFAMLKGGYTAAKATDFGRYMEALQRAGTAYIAMGGSFEQAISAFVAARAVTPSEPLAATLMEQASRMAGGVYEKPRAAMEEALGVKWSEMTMDERYKAMLQYVRGIPAAGRTEELVAVGVPGELAPALGKLITPEATKAMIDAHMKVLEATGETVDDMTESYLKTLAGREAVTTAEAEAIRTEHAAKFADWHNRLTIATAKFEAADAEGRDRFIKDKMEPSIIALEGPAEDVREFYTKLPKGPLRRRGFELHRTIQAEIRRYTFLWGWLYPTTMPEVSGYQATEAFKKLQEEAAEVEPPAEPESPAAEQPPVIEKGGPVSMAPRVYHYYDNGIHYHPKVGEDLVGPRFPA